MAQIKQLKDAISWNSPMKIRERILDRIIDNNDKEIKAEARMNAGDMQEEGVVNI